MASGFESFVALRYLRSKRKEVFISIITVISVLSVAISIMVLNMVLAIMTGFEEELVSKLINADAQIVVRRYGTDIEDWEKVREKIKSVPGVTVAYPFIYRQAMLTTENSAYGVLIRALPNLQDAKTKFAKMLEEGMSFDLLFSPMEVDVQRPDGVTDQVLLPPVILGRELKNRVNLLQGQPVSLVSPQLTSSPMGFIPKLRRFAFVGTYRSGLSEYEAGIGYMSLHDAQNFFSMGSAVTGIEIEVNDLFRAPEIATEIVAKLGGRDSSYYAVDWKQKNRAFMEAIELERRVYFIVLLLLVLIASFSIVSTLVMVVMEKGRDIAVMKTIGATDWSILRIFLLQGVMIGSGGTILGTILGYLGCVALKNYGFGIDASIFSLDSVPVHMKLPNFALVAVSAFVITALSGIYPAWRASRLKPAEALRYE